MKSLRIDCLLRGGVLLLALSFLASLGLSAPVLAGEPPSTVRVDNVLAQVRPKVQRQLQRKGFTLGQPVFIRIFKIPGSFEVWMDKGRGFELFKTYRICSYSGYPGPKLNEGDWQAPEGFYSVSAGRLNPRSQFHLAFDVGYPNAYDVANNRTGGMIMVHGSCKSVGCFAMSDERMEEIYLLAYEALANGQDRFDVHIFPFPLTQRNLRMYAASPWIQFWRGLAPGFEAFERSHQVPRMAVEHGQYVAYTSGSQRIAPQQPPARVQELALRQPSGYSRELTSASELARPVRQPEQPRLAPTAKGAGLATVMQSGKKVAVRVAAPGKTGTRASVFRDDRKVAVHTVAASGKAPKIAARKTKLNMFEKD